ncbi:MAG TPA: Holliday junction resolvase RuvX [Candidatus Saccharimonadales bacterium]|nr:Holliday junction resolvase RuvX [Candidatus Saccharimonadales bacterium]
MRILGLDHGTKRVGLALSDETATIAQPLEFLAAEPVDDFLKRLRDIIDTKGVAEILIGLPRNMNGTYGPAAEKAQELAARLRTEFSIPVKTWDERLTSVQANRYLIEAGMRRDKRKTKVDQTAAAILLQSYLDSRSP